MCTPAQPMQMPAPHELPPRSGLLANPYVEPVAHLLDEMTELVDSLTDAQYTQKPVGVMPSSVAAHVRHCLDHISALLNAVETGQLDYDHRQRGTAVESSRSAAIEHAANLRQQLTQLDIQACEQEVTIQLMMTCDGPKLLAHSTVGREMAFVLSHTIHHNAIIGAMVKTLGGQVPERFGFAPSTPSKPARMEISCAQSA